MPAPVRQVYDRIAGLSDSVFKGTEITPAIVATSMLRPLEEAQGIVAPNTSFRQNREFALYISVISGPLGAQYFARNRNSEIRSVAKELLSYLAATYPENYQAFAQSGAIIPDFKP
jgi:hypothetical protein